MQDELASCSIKTAVLGAAIYMLKCYMFINIGFADLYRYIDWDIIGNDDIAFLNGILGRCGIVKLKRGCLPSIVTELSTVSSCFQATDS